ncbi:MAG TPA: hypothetical protein VEM96_20245 [Pyrinomonadaceae bacterium]|nr:hypothetical protein [Pyrinomonadaceae bacterium]
MFLFHIHVDAAWVSPEFETFLKQELGFFRTDFVGADGGKTEPLNHLTLKTRDAQVFRGAFAQVVTYAQSHRAMAGYVEGEVITFDKDFDWSPHDPNVPTPFKLEMTSLPPKTFRESEFHLTLCPERSDPRLLQRLTEMGLLMIYMPKTWGVALVFTAQGNRNLIRSLTLNLAAFLEKAGGAVMGSLKEERVAKWWTSDKAIKFPPVVRAAQWMNRKEFHARTLRR